MPRYMKDPSRKSLDPLEEMPFELPKVAPTVPPVEESDLGPSPAGLEPVARSSSRHESWQPGPFDHERLEAYAVARDALVHGESVARSLPAEHGSLAHELRRALLGAQLGVAAGASRGGQDRAERFHVARAEAARAAAALDAARALGLVADADLGPTLTLVGRVSAMIARLAARLESGR
jgi:hypothetical protein